MSSPAHPIPAPQVCRSLKFCRLSSKRIAQHFHLRKGTDIFSSGGLTVRTRTQENARALANPYFDEEDNALVALECVEKCMCRGKRPGNCVWSHEEFLKTV